MAQNQRNYQKELERILSRQADEPPRLLLHSCCAPCSSYVLEYLSSYFAITVFYYNPNIYPEEEFHKRAREQERLIREMNQERELAWMTSSGETHPEEGAVRQASMPGHPIEFLEGGFDSQKFYQAVRGLEQIPEGGERCAACFRLRLERAAQMAKAGDYAYFTTTLTISPLKNARVLNEIGEEMGERHCVSWLPCDFKKKNGYKRSIELSARYGLYRQDYCGCVFSRREKKGVDISCVSL